METKTFIRNRGGLTLIAQENIALVWIWFYKTVAEWTADLLAFDTQESVVGAANTLVLSLQGTVDNTLDELHADTVQVLAMLRTKVDLTSDDNEHMVKMLSASGDSRPVIVQEGKDLAHGWELVDDAWVPVIGLTLAVFKAKVEAASDDLDEYNKARAGLRSKIGAWNRIANTLNRDCMAWYNDATHVFVEGTPEGDMIRSIVPTTTDLTPLPGVAELALDAVGVGTYSVTMSAEHATKFDVYQRATGTTEWIKVGVEVPPGLYVQTGLAAGGYEVKAQGRNSRGAGPDSEVVGLTVG